MRTKHVWLLVQVVPLAASIFAISALPSRAAELPSPLETDVTEVPPSSSTGFISTALTTLESSADASWTKSTVESKAASFPSLTHEASTVSLSTEETIAVESSIVLQPWAELDPRNDASSLSTSEVMPREEETQVNPPDIMVAGTSTSSLSEIELVSPTQEDLGEPQSLQFAISAPADVAKRRFSVSSSEIQLSPLTSTGLASSRGESL